MIVLPITKENKEQARKFAEEYDKKGYGYNVLGVSYREYIDFIYYGKLGELVFRDLLTKEKISHECKEILKPHPEKFKRSGSDFVLSLTGETVDTKTADKPYKIRLLVREDQFKARMHDVYVGMKYRNEDSMECWGYIVGTELAKITPKDFGYGPCRHILLKELAPIKKFLELAKAGRLVTKKTYTDF